MYSHITFIYNIKLQSSSICHNRNFSFCPISFLPSTNLNVLQESTEERACVPSSPPPHPLSTFSSTYVILLVYSNVGYRKNMGRNVSPDWYSHDMVLILFRPSRGPKQTLLISHWGLKTVVLEWQVMCFLHHGICDSPPSTWSSGISSLCGIHHTSR